MDQNRDFIVNWAMNHLSSSTWLQEIIRRAGYQTNELSNYFKMTRCINPEKLDNDVPIALASKIATFQISGRFINVFDPIIDYYLSVEA